MLPADYRVHMLSRIGDDDLGHRLAEELLARNLRLDLLQTDPTRPTGQATVRLDQQGDAKFTIEPDAAWDFIEPTPLALDAASRADVILFGSLAQRSSVSRGTIQAILKASTGHRLFDVNLRQDFYTPELLEQSLRIATHAKVNREELEELDGLFASQPHQTDEDRARHLLERFSLEMLSLTRGADGCVLYTADRSYTGRPVSFEPEADSDTVGAGDATNAALIVGLVLGQEPEAIVNQMNRLGAYVATRSGATPVLADDLLDLPAA